MKEKELINDEEEKESKASLMKKLLHLYDLQEYVTEPVPIMLVDNRIQRFEKELKNML